MVMSQRDALDMVLYIWNDPRRIELPRLERIDAAMRPAPMLGSGETAKAASLGPDSRRATVAMPADAPPIMWELARKAESNYLPLLVRTFRQALRVDGYLSNVPDAVNPWVLWQMNRMDARQVGLHDAALKYGAAYTRVVAGRGPDGEPGPHVGGFSPRKMTVLYADAECNEFPIASLHLDGPNGEHLVLTDETHEYRFAFASAQARGGAVQVGSRALEFVDHRPHGVDLGVCPVVRYRDGFYLDGEEQNGIVEPLIVLQERIDETNFGMLVAQYFSAFKQRAIIGWVPESESEELKTSAARAWYLDMDPADVRIHEMAETDLTRYIDSGKAARRDFAAIGQIPAQTLGVDAISNISDATLAGLDRSKNDRAGEIALSLGESHEQTMRLMAHVKGWREAAADWSAEVRWAEREARTWAGQIDGLVKLVQSEILPQDTAIEHVPGFTDRQVERARSDARRARALRDAASAGLFGGE